MKIRYAEEIDYRDYEKQIQKMLNTYVQADEVIQVVEPVNIFEREAFEEEVDKAQIAARQGRHHRQPDQEDDHREDGGRSVLLPEALRPAPAGHRRLQGRSASAMRST